MVYLQSATQPLVGIIITVVAFYFYVTPLSDFYHLSVYWTFWNVFLITAPTSVIIGSFVIICACLLDNHMLFKVGRAFHICGGENTFSCRTEFRFFPPLRNQSKIQRREETSRY